MANNKHVAVLKQGSEAWNRWRREINEGPELERADLSDADLAQADMRGANLSRANLRRANFSGANLSNADLTNADISFAKLMFTDLSGANLRNADLSDADLHHSDLSHADLEGADLSFANLSRADLRGTNLQDAGTGYTIFANSDLSETKGLDRVRHYGPCTIGIDTIYRSKGKIPEDFLLGCGVPESFTAQMHSLVGDVDGIQFYSCFISYSSRDDELARRLHGRMRDARLRVWFAPEDIQGGKKLHEQIETAIRVYDKLLIVLSEASLQSEWVMDELRRGFKAERDTGKRKLFPVRLTDYETLQRWECRDSISGKDLAEEVRLYFIPDFSNWKDHDQFEAAFARLLKDLRAEERAK